MIHSHRFPFWVTIFVLISGLHVGISQDDEALVCTDPVVLEIGEGQIETLHIVLANAKDIYGIDLQATFDPTVVQVLDANPRQTGVQMTSGAFLKPDFTVLNLADNQTGTLRYVVTQLNPTPPVNGKGIVLSVQFRGKAAHGTSSELSITSAVIADRRGTKQSVTTRGAELVIVPRKPSTPTPLPTPSLIPVTRTWPTVTLTRTSSQPTPQPGTTAARNNPPAWPSATDNRNNPAWVPEEAPALSDQVLTYVTVGGFSGSFLLSGLSVWLLAAQRRKERIAKSR